MLTTLLLIPFLLLLLNLRLVETVSKLEDLRLASTTLTLLPILTMAHISLGYFPDHALVAAACMMLGDLVFKLSLVVNRPDRVDHEVGEEMGCELSSRIKVGGTDEDEGVLHPLETQMGQSWMHHLTNTLASPLIYLSLLACFGTGASYLTSIINRILILLTCFMLLDIVHKSSLEAYQSKQQTEQLTVAYYRPKKLVEGALKRGTNITESTNTGSESDDNELKAQGDTSWLSRPTFREIQGVFVQKTPSLGDDSTGDAASDIAIDRNIDGVKEKARDHIPNPKRRNPHDSTSEKNTTTYPSPPTSPANHPPQTPRYMNPVYEPDPGTS